jgi:hypothetical protein
VDDARSSQASPATKVTGGAAGGGAARAGAAPQTTRDTGRERWNRERRREGELRTLMVHQATSR